ncbi:MAG: permease [Pseudomonadota bacterium]
MSVSDRLQTTKPNARQGYVLIGALLFALLLWQPGFALETAQFVGLGFVHVAPLVIPGILLAAWITVSGASDRVAAIFHGNTARTVLAATIVGALLPVCGVTVLPLMAGLLAAGVPLAPVMAFWLASPITGPTMLSATVATLGWEYAVGKTASAIGLGLLGGSATALFAQRDWARSPLRSNRIVAALGSGCGPCGTGETRFEPRIWRSADRRQRFWGDTWSVARLIVIVLIPAFTAEHLLNSWLQPDAVAGFFGRDSAFAVPIAVFVGGPAYIDGYAALPLARALLDHGMSPGAAMAFLVSGGVVSIWGAMAIFPVLRIKPFLLYLGLAAIGSMLSGWGFGAAIYAVNGP